MSTWISTLLFVSFLIGDFKSLLLIGDKSIKKDLSIFRFFGEESVFNFSALKKFKEVATNFL